MARGERPAGTLPFDGEFAEVPTASIWCQQWRDGRHSWWNNTERFDPRRYQVRPIAEKAEKAYVVGAHYSRSHPAARFRFGLHDQIGLSGQPCSVSRWSSGC